MLTREQSLTLRSAQARLPWRRWTNAALLSAFLLLAVGALDRAWSAPGDGDPMEVRLPSPGDRDGRGRIGGRGPNESTDADPDEFSVNGVGIRRPDVALKPVVPDAPHQSSRWVSYLRQNLLMLLRLWFVGMSR